MKGIHILLGALCLAVLSFLFFGLSSLVMVLLNP